MADIGSGMDARTTAIGAAFGALAGLGWAVGPLQGVDAWAAAAVVPWRGEPPVVVVGDLGHDGVAARATRLGWAEVVRAAEPAERWTEARWQPARGLSEAEVALTPPTRPVVWSAAQVDRLAPGQMEGARVVVAATRAEGVRAARQEAARRSGAVLRPATAGGAAALGALAGATAAALSPWWAALVVAAGFVSAALSGVLAPGGVLLAAVVGVGAAREWAAMRRRAEVAEDAAAAALVGLRASSSAAGEGWSAVAALGRRREAELGRLRQGIDALDVPLAVADEAGVIVHLAPTLRRLLDARGLGAPASADELRTLLQGVIHASVVERLLPTEGDEAGGRLLWVAEERLIQVRPQQSRIRPSADPRRADEGNREPALF